MDYKLIGMASRTMAEYASQIAALEAGGEGDRFLVDILKQQQAYFAAECKRQGIAADSALAIGEWAPRVKGRNP